MGKNPGGLLTKSERAWANTHGFVLFAPDAPEANLDKDIRFDSYSDVAYAYGVLGDVWREVIKAERRKVRK